MEGNKRRYRISANAVSPNSQFADWLVWRGEWIERRDINSRIKINLIYTLVCRYLKYYHTFKLPTSDITSDNTLEK